MKSHKNQITAFHQFFKLRKTIRIIMALLSCGFFLFNIIIFCKTENCWTRFFFSLSLVACPMFYIIYEISIVHLIERKDKTALAELISNFILMQLAGSTSIMYVYFNGDMDAFCSWEKITMYASWSNLVLPLSITSFISYLYWMCIIQIFKSSEIYRNCINFKKNEY